MTRNILFVQGGGEGAYAFDAQLAENLQAALGPGYHVQYPPMPDEDSPDDQAWKSKIAGEIEALGDRPIVVAHSVGGTIVLCALAEDGSAAKIAALFLIAPPFIGQGGWSIPESESMAGVGARLPGDLPIYLYHGSADDVVPFAHLELYAKAIPQAQLRRVDDADHQLNNDLSEVATDICRLGQNAAPLIRA
jgi:predicted alpha/beta hydrolase family esterase